MQGQIRVIFTEGSGKGSGNNRTVVNTKTGKPKTQDKVQEEAKASNIVNHAFKNYVVSQAKQVVGLVANEVLYEINKYYTLTDNVEGKRDLNIALGLIHRGGQIVGPTIAGSYFGPVGAVIGFGVGIGREVISLYQGYDQQNIQLRQLNTQLEYSRQRAGYSLTSGSIGEDKWF